MIVFLHAQLTGYYLSCIKSLAGIEEQIHIYKHPASVETPFCEEQIKNVIFYDREKYSETELVDDVRRLDPDIIVCCGWFDKGYLKVCRSFKGQIPIILCMDNQWRKTLRQYAGCFSNRFFGILNCFSGVWASGKPQKAFALKLGFKENQIKTGYYSADVNLFKEIYIANKGRQIAKRFVFVGRYVEIKGILKLWDAFIRLKEEGYAGDWELWCFGTGPLFDKKIEHPHIKHFGFVRPDKMKEYMSEGGIFILPSSFEPWGVVVHEFAAAGFPLLCSTAVGAASKFVLAGQNGYTFNLKERNSIYDSLLKMATKDSGELKNMSIKSHEAGMSYTPDEWVRRLVEFKSGKNNEGLL